MNKQKFQIGDRVIINRGRYKNKTGRIDEMYHSSPRCRYSVLLDNKVDNKCYKKYYSYELDKQNEQNISKNISICNEIVKRLENRKPVTFFTDVPKGHAEISDTGAISFVEDTGIKNNFKDKSKINNLKMTSSNVKNLYMLQDEQKQQVFVVAYNMVEALQSVNMVPVRAELVAAGSYRCDCPRLVV